MSTRSTGRHRRQRSPYVHRAVALQSFGTAVPVCRQHGLARKAGVATAGSLVATAALFGGTVVGPVVPGTPMAQVQQDIALKAAFDLQGLLDGITIAGLSLGQSSPIELIGAIDPQNSLTLGTLLSDLGLTNGMDTTVVQLLDLVNLGNVTVDSLLTPLGLSGTSDVADILTQIQFAGAPIGDITVDSLLGDIAPGLSTSTGLGDALTLLGLSELQLPELNLSLLGLPLVTIDAGSLGHLVSVLGLGDESLSDLASQSGFDITSSTDLSDLASIFQIDTLSIDDMLGWISPDLTGASTIDDLANFFGVGSLDLADLIPGGLTNASSLLDLLNDTALFGDLFSLSIDQLFGLVPVDEAPGMAADAVAGLLG